MGCWISLRAGTGRRRPEPARAVRQAAARARPNGGKHEPLALLRMSVFVEQKTTIFGRICIYWLFERLSWLGCDRGDTVQRWGKQRVCPTFHTRDILGI